MSDLGAGAARAARAWRHAKQLKAQCCAGGAVIWGFDNCILNVDARVLRRAGDEIKLQPLVMDLLLLLVENHRRYLAKQELHQRLWGDVRVGNASLLRLVRELRRALGDDSAKPRLVRTLHGRGYQFIAAVSELPALEPLRWSPLGVRGGPAGLQ
jgi:DNA-binding winged helix-turn-helix (wHTH) protein